MEKVGFYAGSFDPFTRGHLHVVKVSAELFDKVIVGIGINPTKERRFDTDVMADAIRKVLKREGLSNVEVISYNKLLKNARQRNQVLFDKHLGVRHQRGQTSVKLGKFHTEA